MPNHVHLLMELVNISRITPMVKKMHDNPKSASSEFLLTDILRKLKGRTSRYCNLLLNRTGKFWQHESYDRFVRDEKELIGIIKYILQNPVNAGMCKSWENWRWTYLHPDYLSFVL